MSKTEPDEEKSKTWVLLTDSDGTIFQGNMKNVISTVIRFLKQSPEERVTIDKLLAKLGKDLPQEAHSLLASWLAQQESLSWATPAEELTALQQTIAGFFPLIHHLSDDGETKTSCTALDVFHAVWEKQGIVMVLTFNSYAPQTIRHALIQHGLSAEKAQELYIIYPGKKTLPTHDRIYTCEPPGDGEAINKNKFIQAAQKICQEELKLTLCQYLFMDDGHAQSAQKLSTIPVIAITENYATGEHLPTAISFIQGQRHGSRTSVHSSPPSRIFTLKEQATTPVLESLQIRNSGSISLHPEPSPTPRQHKVSDLDLSPPMQPTAFRRLSFNQRGLSAHALMSPQNPTSFFFTPVEKMDSSIQSDSNEASRKLNIPLTPSSSVEMIETTHLIAALPESSHRRMGSSRQEQLESNLNPASSLPMLDHRSATEILEGADALSFMFPKPLEQTFNLAYARSHTLEQKTRTIIQAIDHFYPQTFHHLENAPIRLVKSNPQWELQQWIQKLDDLFSAHEQNPQVQRTISEAARAGWSELLTVSIRATVPGKKKSISQETSEDPFNPISSATSEENILYLSSAISDNDEKSSPLSPSSVSSNSLITRELEKWHQRQRALDSSEINETPCCCLIL